MRRITSAASSHILERGFSIVELSVVIVVLAILLAIVVDTTNGYQSRARDSERVSDVTVITRTLERYYRTQAVASGATYPSSAMNAASLTSYINNSEAVAAPNQTTSSIVIASSATAQTPTISQYIYQPLNQDGSLCTAAPCVRYKVFFQLENTPGAQVKNSMRQQ